MGYDRTAPKCPINVSLNEDLVRQARAYTSNLSRTLENLLQNFIAEEETHRRAQGAATDRVIDSFSAFHAQHGLLRDEFSALWRWLSSMPSGTPAVSAMPFPSS